MVWSNLIKYILGLIFLVSISVAYAKDYSNSPYKEWFSKQKNSLGMSCCDISDGHRFEGDYTINEDGSVTLKTISEGMVLIPKEKVILGSNPTGNAIWWYYKDYTGKRTDYCFAPGSLT